jgi:hypothetical protein
MRLNPLKHSKTEDPETSAPLKAATKRVRSTEVDANLESRADARALHVIQ